MYKEIGKVMMKILEELGILKYLEQFVYWLSDKLHKISKE